MHDRLLSNQAALEREVLPRHARMLGLDVAKFRACLDAGEHVHTVSESIAEAERAGVKGTPGFFLGHMDPNHRKLHAAVFISGAQPYFVFQTAIDELLSPSRAGAQQKQRSEW